MTVHNILDMKPDVLRN